MNIDEKIAECKADIEKCERVCAVTAIGSIRDAAMRKAEDCKQIVEWLEELKQLREQTRWTPISEKLPEQGHTNYLVTVDYGASYKRTSCQRFFYNKELGWDDDSIIAWMPLPAPFKSQESDDENCDEIWEKAYAERDGKTHFNTTEVKIYGQPNEDCISRKSMLEGLKSISKAKSKSDAQKSLMGRVMFFTEHLPSVTPQPEKYTEERTETHACDCTNRKGHWIEHKRDEIEHIECSECRCWFLRKDLIRNSYCPNCGSRNHWEWELKMQEVKK